ncbi:caspase family protein [Streptomyces sp. NPDC093982]|uniref:caspase family protein n=1 Tax=Streptomyces sp. NPDC093982 TaxID=3155077 RepID=UPI003433CD38
MTDRALLVGIDEYPDPTNRLNSCVADTEEFGKLLGRLGFAGSELKVLHDADATLANILECLDWLSDGAQPGDHRVFFQSSHGYRYLKGDVMTEVLCCYDEFLEDTELVRRTAGLPRGVLTVVIDACHSGGMEKAFFVQGKPRLVRAKVFSPPPDKSLASANALTAVRGVKPFGRAPLRDESSLLASFANSPGEAFVPKGVVPGAGELNGILLTACRPDQTAAAGSAVTDWLSAFTYSLLRAADEALPVAELVTRTGDRLAALNMSQTPCIFAPSGQEDMLSRTLVSMTEVSRDLIKKVEDLLKSAAAAADSATTSVSSGSGATMKGIHTMTTMSIGKAVDSLIGGVQKASAPPVPTPAPADTWLSDVQRACALFAPAVAAGMTPQATGRDLAFRQPLENIDHIYDKNFWQAVIDAGRILVPSMMDEFTKSGGPGVRFKAYPVEDTDLHARIAERVPPEFRGNEKFFGLVGAVASIALPLISQALRKDYEPFAKAYQPGGMAERIDLPLPAGLTEAERKDWLTAALNVTADCLPPLIRALS